MKAKMGLILAAVLGAGLSLTPLALAAGAGYTTGPAPVPPGTPGGFLKTVEVSTMYPQVKFPKSVDVKINGAAIDVYALPHTFRHPAQIVIQDSNFKSVNGALAHLGYRGYHAVAGLGLSVDISDRLYRGKFIKPITLFALRTGINARDHILGWTTQGHLFIVPTPLFRNGRAVWKTDDVGAFVVIAPNHS